jgi:hypothetical protein
MIFGSVSLVLDLAILATHARAAPIERKKEVKPSIPNTDMQLNLTCSKVLSSDSLLPPDVEMNVEDAYKRELDSSKLMPSTHVNKVEEFCLSGRFKFLPITESTTTLDLYKEFNDGFGGNAPLKELLPKDGNQARFIKNYSEKEGREWITRLTIVLEVQHNIDNLPLLAGAGWFEREKYVCVMFDTLRKLQGESLYQLADGLLKKPASSVYKLMNKL